MAEHQEIACLARVKLNDWRAVKIEWDTIPTSGEVADLRQRIADLESELFRAIEATRYAEAECQRLYKIVQLREPAHP